MSQQENFNALIKGLNRILSDEEKLKLIRPSQQKILTDFVQSPEQFKTGIFDLATAFGKTRIMALLADAYRQNAPNQIIIVEPALELVEQIATDFKDYFGHNLKIGKFFSHKKDTSQSILITTYNSLENLAKTINPQHVGLLLLDEGHHAVSDKRMEVVRQFVNACQYGMTATPDYSEDRTLKNLLTYTIAHVDIPQGVQDGILSPFSNSVLFSTFQLDLSRIKRTGTGDYDIVEYRQAFSKALSPVHMDNTVAADWQSAHRKISQEVALFYQSVSEQKKHCLINCHTQEEAKIQAEEINKVFGRTVAGVWTTDTQKTSSLKDFEAGRLVVLCQVGMLQEGYDFPALDLCINYPTASRVRATQRGGRTLRLDPSNPQKNATIVDIVFSFPGSKNPYTSARKNNQVLYSDVVRAIAVAPNTSTGTGKGKPLSLPKISPLNLKYFKLVSDIKTLLTLKRKDQQAKAAEYVPLKQEGMLSHNDLKDILGGTPNKYFDLLQKIYENPALNIRIDSDNKPFELVQYVRSGKSKTLCLSNHPEAMAIFLGICKENYQRRDSNKISLEEYARGHYLSQDELHKICLLLHAYKFKVVGENGSFHTLIAKHQFQQGKLLLEDSEDARQDLHNLIQLTDYLDHIPEIPKGMYDLVNFKARMMIKNEVINPSIRRAILEGKTYTDQNGQQKPLAQFYVERISANGEKTYGICVPQDILGQKELLRLCGFKVFTCDVSQVTCYEERWNTFYKKAIQEGFSLRELGRLYNISGERARQIISDIQRSLNNVLREVCRTRDHSNFIINRPSDKYALYITDTSGDFLITQTALTFGYSKMDNFRDYLPQKRTTSQIIKSTKISYTRV